MAQDGSSIRYYFEDLDEGMSAEFTKTVTEADIIKYAEVSGDTNPVHLDAEFAVDHDVQRTHCARHADRRIHFGRLWHQAARPGLDLRQPNC